jgi:hypothetical protein
MKKLAVLCTLITTSLSLAPHPRLILTPERSQFLSKLSLSTDPFAKLFVSTTISQANVLVKANRQEVCNQERKKCNRDKKNQFDIGLHAAPNARYIVQDVYNLGISQSLTGNKTYGLTAVDTFLQAALNPSWDTNASIPQLNTGEMLHAVGLGLDWFYDLLTPKNRSDIVLAISKRLSLIRDALSSSPPSWSVAFVSTPSNWNSVILGGTIIASLAIEGEQDEPIWNTKLRNDALSNILSYSALAWSPAGAWPEGVNYGGYSMRYMTPLIASLLSSTGDDAGLRAIPGLLQSPRWLISNVVPTHPYPELWDYFDARKTPETIGSYLAVANWANDAPAAAGIKRLLTSLSSSIPIDDTETTSWNAPLACLYYSTLGEPGDDLNLPLVSSWNGPLTSVMRSSWVDENATFIAFKGHNTSALWAHTHLDAGSFVFATQGQWFAQDLSSDEYSAPGYFSPSRFNLYRTNISGHNTISFGGRNPYCKIISTYSSDCPASPIEIFNITNTTYSSINDTVSSNAFFVDVFAIVNLTEGFVRDPILGVQRVERGFIVGYGMKQLITVDEIIVDPSAPAVPIWWTLHTVANVSVSQDSTSANLTTWNTTSIIQVSILNSSFCIGAKVTVSSLNLEPPLLPSPDVNVIRIVSPNASDCTVLAVSIGENLPTLGSKIRPLTEWYANGPFM